NPVVTHRGRDPRLLWHEKTRRWVMAVYDEDQDRRSIAFHSSADLKTWRYESQIEPFFECPDLFELPVVGAARASTRWVLSAADGRYLLGEFDGRTFTPDGPEKQQLWYGNDRDDPRAARGRGRRALAAHPSRSRLRRGVRRRWGRGVLAAGGPLLTFPTDDRFLLAWRGSSRVGSCVCHGLDLAVSGRTPSW